MSAPPGSGRGSGRLATRLAWRELRRRPLRAVLVVLLVAAPVFALTVADVLLETSNTHRPGETFRREYGDADLVYLFNGAAAPVETFAPPFPSGTRELRFRVANLPLTPANGEGLRRVDLSNAAFGSRPDLAGLQLMSGRAPRAGANEMTVSRNVADWLRVTVGDAVRFARPEFSARVTGIVRSTADFATPVVDAPGFDFGVVHQPGFPTGVVNAPGFDPGAVPEFGVGQGRIAIDLPGGFSVHRAAADRSQLELRDGARRLPMPKLPVATPLQRGGSASSGVVIPQQFGRTGGIPVEAKLWSWVGAALLLAMVSVIIAAAFATTARRQLVTLGQLAANGSDQRFLRRMLTRQGTMIGILGAALGIGAAVGSLLLWHSWIETLYRHELDYALTWDLAIVGVTAIIAATAAARFPARATSRIPVLAALAGRRPLPPIPRLRWLKATIVFGTGVALLLLVALASSNDTPQISAVVAITGGLFVLAGAAFMTPVVLTLLARIASRIGAAPRLAARSLVRVRGRSAAIVTSIAVAGALAIAVLTAMFGLGVDRIDQASLATGLPADAVLINSVPGFDTGARPGEDDPRVQAAVESVLPGTRVGAVRGRRPFDLSAPSRLGPAVVVINPDQRWLVPGAANAALDRTGAFVASSESRPAGGRAKVALDTPTGTRALVAERFDGGLAGWFAFGTGTTVVLTPARFAELGLTADVLGYVGRARAPISASQSDALQTALSGSDPYTEVPSSIGSTGIVITGGSVPVFWRGFWSPGRLQLWFAGGALLFVLVVVAIGLLLGSAEARDERDVLEALGAPPRTERRMSGVRALVLALGGAVLAIPTGFIPVAVVFRALQEPSGVRGPIFESSVYPLIRFPWVTAIGILVVIPLTVLVGAWIATAIAQRTRPLRSAVFGAE